MRSLKLSSDHIEKRRIERNCHQLLDKAERLRSGNGSSAFAKPSDAVASAKTDHPGSKYPVPSRQFTTQEHIILLKGSKLHGSVFPPWESDPEPREFELLGGKSPYLCVEAVAFSEASIDASWHSLD